MPATKKKSRKPRAFPNVVVKRTVRNGSQRAPGQRVDQAGVHTTESGDVKGISDVVGMVGYFDRAGIDASSTVVNDAEGNSGRCLPDSMKPWTQAAYNGRAVTIEQIARAAFTRKVWFSRTPQLDETARWLAYWSIKHPIPLKHVLDPDAPGVHGHKSYGAAGGGHVDPGPNYPWRYVMARARVYRAMQLAHFAVTRERVVR